MTAAVSTAINKYLALRKRELKNGAEWLFTKIGERLDSRKVYALETGFNYISVGFWLRDRNFFPIKRYPDRERLWEAVVKPFADKRVLFLEFGVWRGDSIRRWSTLLTNPASSLHGFDSFQGLPESWNYRLRRGALNVHGRLPTVTDPRIVFHKGLFRQTLPGFDPPDCDVMIVHIDADLYSSTTEVLRHLSQHIIVGTILIFDDFQDRNHERRAFEEFMNESDFSFRLLGASRTLVQVAFMRVD